MASREEIDFWADKMVKALGPVIPPDHIPSSDILRAMRGHKLKIIFLEIMEELFAKKVYGRRY